ncbi:MAG: Cof-type HAD-IIB family hydrolase [Lachnospiraceae bacterium]|nr:Cof-type HAD-IIB family hydrolase [Lachnospiraceae bacterium]
MNINGNEIKLVCTDIDGTLVPDGTPDLNPEYYDVVKQLKEKGVMFAAASGRQCNSIEGIFKPVKDDIIMIGENGGLVICRDQLMSCARIDTETAYELIRDMRKLKNTEIMVATKSNCYIQKDYEELDDLLTNGYHFKLTRVDDLLTDIDPEDPIIKVSLYNNHEGAEEIAKDFFAPKWEKREDIQVLCAGFMWLDCISVNSGKGKAIAEIQRQMGIKPSETVVFGDNLNDIEMLEQAKYSFAVANARDEVKNAAAGVVDSNVNDGVLKKLKEIFAL